MSMNLKLSGVRKGFANFLLGAIDLELEEGKVLALIGPNGAGKTTTMDCISGILQPDKGEIEICGIRTSPKTKDWKYNFGYVMSEPVFINSMTGSEFLKFVSKYYPVFSTGPYSSSIFFFALREVPAFFSAFSIISPGFLDLSINSSRSMRSLS